MITNPDTMLAPLAQSLVSNGALELLPYARKGTVIAPRTAETQGLLPFLGRQGALAKSLHGLNPRNTDSPTRKALMLWGAIPIHSRAGLILDAWGRLAAASPDTAQVKPPISYPYGVGGRFAVKPT